MPKYRTRIVLALITLTVPAAGVARTLRQILNENELIVGVVLIMPWAIRPSPRELTGFEIDVANELANDLGVEIDLRVYTADRIISALEAGEIDLIAAGLSITPERALHVNFSNPYSTTGITMAVNRETTVLVSRLEDFDDPEYRLATVAGSEAAELAVRIFPQAEVVEFDSVELASDALLEANVDAYLEDEPIPNFLALENPSTIDVPLSGPLVQRRAGFAVNKGDPDFLAFLNAWITAKQADTWLPTIHDFWFESLRWREP
jgi:polar amino acid transport system substrate-binding protein